jgi:hypothetical protein
MFHDIPNSSADFTMEHAQTPPPNANGNRPLTEPPPAPEKKCLHSQGVGISLCIAAAHGYSGCLSAILQSNVGPQQINFLAGCRACWGGTHVVHKPDWTPLMLAAANGHHACVKALMKAGSYHLIHDENNETALTLSIRNGHVDCLSELLPSYPSYPYWGEALMLATKSDKMECVQVILNQIEKHTMAAVLS